VLQTAAHSGVIESSPRFADERDILHRHRLADAERNVEAIIEIDTVQVVPRAVDDDGVFAEIQSDNQVVVDAQLIEFHVAVIGAAAAL
jgi:hypothetical protein